jgi:hypothetical protein
MLSVFPSAADAKFLAACPGRAYERLAEAARADFRRAFPDWARWDWAHWILLLDEREVDGAIHLHTTWSFEQELAWLRPTLGDSLPTLVSAPGIIPVELMNEDIVQFRRRELQEDAKCGRGR